jgi:inner membrane protein
MIEQPQQTGNRYKDSVLIKLGIIAVLIILLLIPSSWIQRLIIEREGYQQLQRNSVTGNWADSQLVQGPVLLLPYKKQITETSADKKSVTREVINMLYVLPQNLQVKATVKTEPVRKGVYDATVYSSKIAVSGSFNKPDLAEAGIEPSAVLYEKAQLVFSVTDLKGLKNSPVVKIMGKGYTPEPSLDETMPFRNGLKVNFPLQMDTGITFSYLIDLKGSNELDFLHTGKTTDVEISSDWKSPDFGSSIPDKKIINDQGFTANWHMLYYNRPYPQQWINNNKVLLNKKYITAATFGVKLQLPIDQYRKILRTTKYSTLIILLTFVSLFLAEMIKKQRVHVFNYILIGAAMVVYYTLLLSFSEQIGYNWAYLLSSVSTIVLIATFTASLLNNKIVAITFSFILTIFYGFIFIIIQLEELSLLFGSVALFIVVATLMYFSRKINWDKQ